MLENLPPHKHEYWVMEGMLPLGGGEIRRKVALLPKMECDAIIRMELPEVFWADLAGWSLAAQETWVESKPNRS